MFIVQILQQKVELSKHACDNYCKQMSKLLYILTPHTYKY